VPRETAAAPAPPRRMTTSSSSTTARTLMEAMQDLQNSTTLPDGLAGTRVPVVDGATSTGAAAVRLLARTARTCGSRADAAPSRLTCPPRRRLQQRRSGELLRFCSIRQRRGLAPRARREPHRRLLQPQARGPRPTRRRPEPPRERSARGRGGAPHLRCGGSTSEGADAIAKLHLVNRIATPEQVRHSLPTCSRTKQRP
jgi:hypothetical protein